MTLALEHTCSTHALLPSHDMFDQNPLEPVFV